VGRANQETRRLGGTIIGDVEVLLGVIKETNGVARRALCRLDVDVERLAGELEREPRRAGSGAAPRILPQTEQSKLTIQASITVARELRHRVITTAHLLLGLLRHGDFASSRILGAHGVSPDRVKRAIADLGGSADARNWDD
jgi:ATP-dependent Clp protease ATP-binding subunit ClpC